MPDKTRVATRRAWLFAVALMAHLLMGAGAARAGEYWVAPQSRTGSVTLTPNVGTPTTESLDDSDGSWSSPYGGFFGSISYSYTATIRYSWIPDNEADTPQSQTLTLSGDSTINLSSTSAALYYSSTATSSFTMFGSTHSRTGTNTAHYPDPPDTSVTGVLMQTHTQDFVLSGDGGTFTYTVTGSLNTGSNSVFSGELAVALPQFADTVKIKAPAGYSTKQRDVNFQVKAEWFTPAARYTDTPMRVAFHVNPDGPIFWTLKAGVSIGPFIEGTATATIQINTPGEALLRARFEVWNASFNRWDDAGIPPHTIHLTVQ